MIVTERKSSRVHQVKSDLTKLTRRKKTSGKKKLSDYYGKLKGVFGDGLTYQKQVRSEWK
jgi:hypothetical protein